MKRTFAVLSLLVLVAGVGLGCESKLSDTDPNNKQNILKGNGGDASTPGSGGSSAPAGRGLTPGEAVKPPPPPAK